MSGHIVTQSDTTQPEQVIMVRGIEVSEEPEPELTCCGAPKSDKDIKREKDLKRSFTKDGRPREVYTTTSSGEKMLVRLNIQLKGGQGCFKPEPMLYHAGDSDTVPPALQELGMT